MLDAGCWMLDADLFLVAKEEKLRTLLGAKRPAIAVVRALHTVETEAHDTLFQVPLFFTDFAVNALAFHDLERSPPEETSTTPLTGRPNSYNIRHLGRNFKRSDGPAVSIFRRC